MKIIVLTNLFPNPIQPHLAPWNREQLRALSTRHDVRVIAPVLWTDEWSAWRRKERGMPANRRSVCDGIPVDHPRYYYPPKVLRGAYGEWFRRSVAGVFRRAVRQARPDVVYSSWAYPDGWAAVRLSSAIDVPVVIRVHGSDILSLGQHPDRMQPTVNALQRADAVVAVSHDLADSVARLGVSAGKISVVYNGLDTDVFRPGCRTDARRQLSLPQDRNTILFAGNLVPVKQVDVLLHACARLRQRGVEFHCHLLGDGPLRRSLDELAVRLGLSDCVTFHGQQPQERLVDWYRSANVVALPSRSEGIPNVLLEAAACGIPYVASRVGGIPEIDAAGRCRLVAPGDAEELAEALTAFLEDDGAQPESPTNRARSWDDSARELEDVLLRAVCRTKQCR